ncbi:MAG: hypothetical protein ACOVLC_08300 [Flavobacterium sp.]
MANTIELEKNENIIDKVEINTIDIENDSETDVDCRLEKFKAYNFFRGKGYTHDEATSSSWTIYFNCERERSLSMNKTLSIG